MQKDLLDLTSLSKDELISILDLADELKKNPQDYSQKLKDKTLLMIFAKPSLRTRVSFEVGMTQMGGHGIYYDVSTSPMGKKETIADTAATTSRYVDIIMARLFEHDDIIELAQHATVPVINALTNYSHPCQILADLQTIREKKGKLEGLTLSYFGDGNNNVTHSLMFGCSIVGMNINIASPAGKDFEPQPQVLEKAKQLAEKSGAKIMVTNDANEAIGKSDIVCTDSWMSYHIPDTQKDDRVKMFSPYRVSQSLMEKANKDAIFMHCLPAQRGMEVDTAVIEGVQSVVFDEAENRLHAQKALILKLLNAA